MPMAVASIAMETDSDEGRARSAWVANGTSSAACQLRAVERCSRGPLAGHPL